MQHSSPASSAPLATSRWSPATTEHAFDGTISSACRSTGITLEQMFEMMRRAKESDPRIRELLDAWDALDPSEHQSSLTVDAVRLQLGLAPVELLRIVADVACRIAMYQAQIIAALSHPQVVEKTVELALNAEDDSNKLTAQTILHKATGFLPIPKGSHTNIAITQNAQANATARSIVAAPSPEHTIRRLTDRFNAVRGFPPSPASRNIDALRVPLPDGVEEDEK